VFLGLLKVGGVARVGSTRPVVDCFAADPGLSLVRKRLRTDYTG
jgi:hypothetical protein